MNYMVLYEGGNGGTWLTWLVNHHKDFPKFNMNDNIRKNITKSRDVCCAGADWHLEGITVDDGQGGSIKHLPLSWEDYLKYTKEHIVNKDHKHIAFKIIPNHSARTFNNKKVDTELLNNISQQVEHKIIFCFVGELFNSEISRRWNILRKEKESTEEIKNRLITDRRTSYNVEQDYAPFTSDICIIDIGKIITGDMTEYEKLCDFIEQPKLNNFKQLADDYRKKFS